MLRQSSTRNLLEFNSIINILILFLVYSLICAAETAVCPFRDVHSTVPATGFIESPGFPSAYKAPLDCLFNITTSPSNVIQLSFSSFDLGPRNPVSNQCLDAYIIIIVVDRQGRHHIGPRLCGDVLPAPINTMQYWVQVQFVTVKANQAHKGFKLQYRMVSEAAIEEPKSLIDEPFKGCGGHTTLGQLSGEIVSPGWPVTYPKNSTCNWLIRVESRQRIYIRIVHLHLSSTIAECERATLSIIDGYKHENDERKETSESSEAKFCGSMDYYSEEGMKSYLSSANRIIVRLATRDRPPMGMKETRIGFKIIWTAVEGMIDETPGSAEQPDTCQGHFLCHGGQVCVEQGHGVCATRSRLCIHKSLACDGVHNCVEGDFSDEQHCYSREIATVAGLGFILMVSTMLLFVCCDQMRKRKRVRELIRERRRAATGNGKCPEARLPPNR